MISGELVNLLTSELIPEINRITMTHGLQWTMYRVGIVQ